MNSDAHIALVNKALMNNSTAIDLFNAIAWASQVIDDYWDGDKAVSRDEMLQVILVLTVDIQRNAFFRAVQDDMVGIIEDALCFWMQASDLEEAAKSLPVDDANTALQVSYINRSVITDVLIRMARLIGGRQHERRIASEIRLAVYGDNEPLSDYINEHLRR